MLGLLAAAAHDVDHPGVNQPFLIKTNHHLANLYQVRELNVEPDTVWPTALGPSAEAWILPLETASFRVSLSNDYSKEHEFEIGQVYPPRKIKWVYKDI